MNYPLISEYVEAIKAAEDNFDQLKHLRPVLGEDGEPVMTSGNFAVVFKMKDEQTGKLHAVKCFLKEQEGRAEAYRQIAEELEFVSSTFLTPIKYLDKELFVDSANSEDSEFPVLLMDWVEGQTLDKYIREHIDDQYELSLLVYQFSRLAMWLMPQPFAHGDLKPDNILVKEDGTLVLVDYDGMYVPAMKGQKARELGSPDFRHPGRTEEVFDDHIDDFSLASILLSLKAIALQPSLLEEYGASDRLMFSEKDYRNLSESSALGALQPLMQDAELASLYSLYILALSQNNLSQVSFRLFNLGRPKDLIRIDLGTEVLEQDYINCWEDEFGARYSKDRKRLIDVPDGLEEYVIRPGTKVICDNAFDLTSETLNHVVIPQSVIKIGKDAFAGCLNLHQVIIPDNVIEIKEGAFDESGLKSITIPEGIRNLEESVFAVCEKLETVKLPYSLKTIGDFSFEYCSKLKTIIIPNNVCRIGDYAFRDCQELKSVIMPDGLETIGENIFYGCSSLNCICVPPNYISKYEKILSEYKDKLVEYDGDGNLNEEVTDDDLANAWTDEYGVKYSKDKKRLLKVPKELRDYSIIEGTMVICNHVFTDLIDRLNYFVKGLKKSDKGIVTVTVPNSVKLIGKDAFTYCRYLSSIYIPIGTKQKFEDLLPNYIDKLIEQYNEENLSTEVTEEDLANAWIDEYGVKYSADGRRLLNGENCNSEDYSIREGTTIICDLAFAECSSLTSIALPESIVSVGDYAFDGCWSISSITIPSKVFKIGINPFNRTGISEIVCNSPFYKTDGVALYDRDMKRLVSVCRSIEAFIIPDGLVEIGESAFYDCHLLQSINIPDSVCEIKKGAFQYCRSLKNVTLSNSLVSLEDEVFGGCDSLESIKIPDNIFYIGNNTFEGCFKLETISIPESVCQIGHYAFCGCESLKTIVFPEGVCFIGVGAFSGCSSLKSISLPQNDYGILEHTFSHCSSLASISIPNSINGIGVSAFYGCHSLESLIIPSSVKTIGDCAFSGCYSLKNVTIQNGVISIGGSAFSHCRSLEKINIPDSITSFGDLVDDGYTSWNGGKPSAFDFCDSLKSLIIPYGSREKFEILLPELKDKLVEQGRGWRIKETRPFSPDEIAAVARAEVVPSQYGNSVCFFMNGGGQTFIPLLNTSSLTVGDSVDLKTAKIVTLCREGKDDIYRVIEQ